MKFCFRAFTQRAIQITSCIYDADKKKEKDEKDKKRKNTENENEEEEKELGNPIMQAGRLLLNHGYIEDAIKTQNKTFLDNSTINKILNKMWYGEEELSFKRV